ncbi:MAG: TfoX/Sxy family protein [Oscillospiraceae bacterium]|nr:TfoX/Sxy family protein [Oscillospiraceae bacterium]
MPSSKGYLDFILDQLSQAEDISHRTMMGEYILYCKGKVFGGIYDDRFLVKPVKAAKALLPDAPLELPYEGAKPMLLVEEVEDKAFLAQLIAAMEPELPAPKKR